MTRKVSVDLRIESEYFGDYNLMGVAMDVRISGQKAKRGERMTGSTGWRLATTRGRKRVFVGTLLKTFNLGSRRIAIFSVPK